MRTWYRLYGEEGIEGPASFGYERSTCRLSEAQQDKLKAWIAETLPRTTREVGDWIEKEYGIEYQGRSGLIALLHRLGMEHRKPKTPPQVPVALATRASNFSSSTFAASRSGGFSSITMRDDGRT